MGLSAVARACRRLRPAQEEDGAQNGNVFIGDYIDIDSSDACAWPVWVDTSLNQKADVMTSCVQRPGDVVAS